MIIKKVIVRGVLDTNSYFCIDEQSKAGILIDPGAEAGKLLQTIHDEEFHISKILITHGHFDHIGAVEELVNVLKIPYFIHEEGRNYLTNPLLNLSPYFGSNMILNKASFFKEGDEISVGEVKLRVIHTPGHTLDSSTFYDVANKLAFVGDTIFRGSVGATHYPGGSVTMLSSSIFNKIFSLPDDTILYPGHSAETDVKTEKAHYVKE